MARDAESLKIKKWAARGDRLNPENAQPPLNRADGWTVEYTQIGGVEIRRDVYNQMLCEQTAMLVEINRGGVILEYDETLAARYTHPCFVRGSDGKIYVSLRTQLSFADPINNPTQWREY